MLLPMPLSLLPASSCRVQVATSLADGKKYAAKIIKKSEGKEALLLQLQSKQLGCTW
jgi:hypothetical protein